jgi:excisionase family DNA binding protein
MARIKKQLTYDDAAVALRCSPRHVRRLLKKHRIEPIRLGHRTVRFPAEKISELVIKLLPGSAANNGKAKR